MKFFKPLTLATLTTSLFLISTPLLAGKQSGVTGSLAMQQSPGIRTLSSSPDGEIIVTYGEDVTFDVVIEGRVANKSRVYVTVVCTQDTVVFQASNWTDFKFTMTDLAGQGLDWDPEGGPALCSANLIYRVEKGREASLTLLDNETFSVD